MIETLNLDLANPKEEPQLSKKQAWNALRVIMDIKLSNYVEEVDNEESLSGQEKQERQRKIAALKHANELTKDLARKIKGNPLSNDFFASRNNDTLLTISIRTGLIDIAEAILDAAQKQSKLPAVINEVDGLGYSPLMLALHGGHLQLAQTLIDRGANVYAKDPSGRNMFMLLTHAKLPQKDMSAYAARHLHAAEPISDNATRSDSDIADISTEAPSRSAVQAARAALIKNTIQALRLAGLDLAEVCDVTTGVGSTASTKPYNAMAYVEEQSDGFLHTLLAQAINNPVNLVSRNQTKATDPQRQWQQDFIYAITNYQPAIERADKAFRDLLKMGISKRWITQDICRQGYNLAVQGRGTTPDGNLKSFHIIKVALDTLAKERGWSLTQDNFVFRR